MNTKLAMGWVIAVLGIAGLLVALALTGHDVMPCLYPDLNKG